MSPLARTPFDDLDDFAVLTAAEVAARMRVDPRSVRRAAARGELPASRACGVRILAADAAEWWRSRRSAPDSAPDPARGLQARQRAPRSPRFQRSVDLPLPPRGERA